MICTDTVTNVRIMHLKPTNPRTPPAKRKKRAIGFVSRTVPVLNSTAVNTKSNPLSSRNQLVSDSSSNFRRSRNPSGEWSLRSRFVFNDMIGLIENYRFGPVAPPATNT